MSNTKFSSKKNKPWIVFFSQTGTEIVDLVEKIGRIPDRIITNERPSHLREINKQIFSWANIEQVVRYTPNKPTVEDYERLLYKFDNPIITLHGWLRVIPPELCKKYTILNGHPGLITEYPELKGKDPQIRAYKGKFKQAGCVIHRVTAGVDEGEVVLTEKFSIEKLEINDLFTRFRDTSLNMWVKFLKKVL